MTVMALKGVAGLDNGKTIKAKIRNKGQVTINKELLDAIGAHEGDEIGWSVVDGVLIGRPYVTVSVPKDQAWFYSDEWQREEQAVDEWIASGGIQKASTFKNPEDAIDFLDSLTNK